MTKSFINSFGYLLAFVKRSEEKLFHQGIAVVHVNNLNALCYSLSFATKLDNEKKIHREQRSCCNDCISYDRYSNRILQKRQ